MAAFTGKLYLGTDETDVCALGPSGESVVIASTNIMADRPYEDRCADAAQAAYALAQIEEAASVWVVKR